MSDKSVVRRSRSVGGQVVRAGTATEMQILLGTEDGVPNFAMRRFSMGEGGGMPYHTNAVEHEQYVLRGKAVVRIGKEEHEVETGMVLYIPAGVPHDYTVVEAPFEFLCLVPNAPDEIKLVEGGC